ADFAESPKHPHAQKDLPVPGRVIVEYADRTPLTGAPHLPQQIDGDVAGADHEHRFAGEVNVAVQSALLPGAIGDPAARHDRGKRREKLLWGGFQVEAQPERKHPANSGSEHVVRKGECSSVTGLKRIQWICSRVAATRSPPTARALRGARPAR